jgi:branched-chain amino acid transport system ATP-binding protein
MAHLSVRNLEVHYGDVVGVSDVSLEIKPGTVVALLGSNGAGKTTTLSAIAGLIRSQNGTIEWNGESIAGAPAFAIVRRGIALSPEGWRLFVTLTVEQNLRLGASTLNDARKIAGLLDRVYTIFPRLASRRRQRAATLSGGERQMLAVGRALMSEPDLLMLDEPSLGLAPAIVDALYETLQQLHADGVTLLLAEQSVQLALEFADYGYVLQTGRTVLEGAARALSTNPEVRRIYLGV